MKSKILCLLAIISLTACSNEECAESSTESQDQGYVSTPRSRVAEAGGEPLSEKVFAFIDNNIIDNEEHDYVITASKEEAMEMGLTAEEYDLACKTVDRWNAFFRSVVQKSLDDPNVTSVTISDAHSLSK